MKKRLLSFLLVLCTLLSVFPVMGVAADEVLPKDETPGGSTSSGGQTSAMSEYDKLYVGADGSETANGGKLVAYYSAIREDAATVDLTAKTWADKLGKAAPATFKGDGWYTLSDGGFGYDFPYDSMSSVAGSYVLALPESFLELSSLYIETLGRVNSFREADGTIKEVTSNGTKFNPSTSSYASFVRIDLLSSVFFIGMPRTGDCEKYGNRWVLTYQGFSHFLHYGGLPSGNYTDSAYYTAAKANGLKPVILTAQYERVVDAFGTETYTIGYPTSERKTMKAVTVAEKAELAKVKPNSVDKAAPLSFFNGIPSDVYSIRVYSAPLTERERNQNAAADVLAYAGADLTEYLSLSSAGRASANKMLAAGGIIEDKAKLEESLANICALCKNIVDVSETYYVQDGLTFFASAYKDLNTGYTENSDGSLKWTNALKLNEGANLKGGYAPNENGGYTIEKTYEQFLLDSNYGIYMPASACPQGDYTVELVFNPVGLSYRDEDGVLNRYIDEITKTGVYLKTKNGNAIGPLRCIQFVCYRPASAGAQMERRWGYWQKGAAYEDGGVKAKPRRTDQTWGNLEIDEIVIMSITHKREKIDENTYGNETYKFYHNAAQACADMVIGPEEYISPSAAGNQFQFMIGLPGTAYSIRVYDRTLTPTEIAQNKIADLAYYYGLDITRALELAELMGDASSFLLDSLAKLSFTMEREEAQRLLDNRIAAGWIAFENIGVRKGDVDATRFYFTCNAESVTALADVGYQVEMGAVVNMGKDILPTLEGDAFDYKLNMYGSASSRNAAFFVDDDTFAVTVRYNNTDKAAALANVKVRGYVKLTSPDGAEFIYYADPPPELGETDNLFVIYDGMLARVTQAGEYDTLNRMNKTLDRCYAKQTVYVNAAADTDGNGTKDAPYRSFAAGFAACKEILARNASPLRLTMLLADGVYGIYETQELSGKEVPYQYTSFEITSENGNTTLTTTKDITCDFEQYADNIWVAQLDKEEDGAYPCFRYLYVDGKIAELSYNGRREMSDVATTSYTAGFERSFDGPWNEAKKLYDAGTISLNSTSSYTRQDLIDSFEYYKLGFLALKEVETTFKAGTLTPTTVSGVSLNDADDQEVYLEFYESLKMRRLVIEDMKKQFNALDKSLSGVEKKTKFTAFVAKDFEDAAYKTAFKELNEIIRKPLESMSLSNITAYEPMVENTALADSKYFLREELLGDLSAAMDAGEARHAAALEALQAQYDAADAAGKAALEAELAEAKRKTKEYGELTWFRYALEDCGPEMFQAGEWWQNVVHVQGVDYEDYTIDASGKKHVAVYLEPEEYKNFYVHRNYTIAGRNVFMKNALIYVDGEGEYYYDEVAGKLYYYSEDGVSGKSFERGTNDYMLYFKNAKNITVSNLHITGVDDAYVSHNDACVTLGNTGAMPGAWDRGWEVGFAYDRAAIVFDSGENLTVADCNFDELGSRAIFGRNVLHNVTVENNSFVNLGAAAVHFGGGGEQRTWSYGKSELEDITISNNYIYDIGREYYSCFGIFLPFGKNITIIQNTVEKCPYSAIGLGFYYNPASFNPEEGEAYHIYNAEISYNFVSAFMREIGDGGGIYVSGGNGDVTTLQEVYFNYIHDNYVLFTNDTGNTRDYMAGIYLDGSSSNWHCYNNVLAEHSYGAAYGEGDGVLDSTYLANLRTRRGKTTYIFPQRISSQLSYHILFEENYILNVRATTESAQQLEVFGKSDGVPHIDPSRGHIVENMHYINDIMDMPMEAEEIICAAGSIGHEGDPYILWENY